MSKCCDSSCSCRLIAGADISGHDSILITGTGSVQDPFVMSFVGLNADDGTDIDFTLTWDDTTGYHLTAGFSAGSKLDHIADVNASAPTNGQVLSWNSTSSTWVPVNPTTVPAGTIHRDTSLTGDGSVGSPLAVAFATGGGIQNTTGLGLTDAVFQQLARKFATAAARTSADPSPTLNALSMLDTAPGLVDYWNGTAWKPLLVVGSITATEYLALSGAYDGRSTKLYIAQVSTVTASDGSFVAISVATLAGAAGVVSATIQPVGPVPFFTMLDATDTTQVAAFAFAADGSGALVSQSISFTVTAYLY